MNTSKRGLAAAAFVGSLLSATALAQLSEYGIEGLWVVSTRSAEMRGSVAPDGQRIVWGSADRPGGPGGGDLWQATLREGRWSDPVPLSLNSPADDAEPMFSADGRWLYFASSRTGGRGGHDLYRAAVRAGGGFGAPESLGDAVNTRGDERSPTLRADGQRLMFASDGHGGAGGLDLFVSTADGTTFARAAAVPGINTRADEIDSAWLDDGRALLFSRSGNAAGTARLHVATCDGHAYADATPWSLSFNTPDGATRAPVIDASKPTEIIVTGTARAPKAGLGDLYRTTTPKPQGQPGCP